MAIRIKLFQEHFVTHLDKAISEFLAEHKADVIDLQLSPKDKHGHIAVLKYSAETPE